MDDVPEEGLPSEGQDREAAATLAEMASSLAEAAAPQMGEGDSPMADAQPIRSGNLRRLFERLPRPDIRRRLNPRRWTRPRLALDRRRLLRSAVALALSVALVLGFSGSAAPLNGHAPRVTPPRVAAASPTAAFSSSASMPSGDVPAGTSSPSARPSQSPNPLSPGRSAPGPTSPTATITFTSLMLDPVPGSGSERAFAFTSDGPGAVSAQIVAASPMDSTELCMAADDAAPECDRGATPGLTQTSAGVHSHWIVTLVSGNADSPTVDVQFSWPTDNPKITVSHARFQGYPNPDSLRTLSATFQARAAGNVEVDAAWPPVAADATLTLTDVSSAQPAAVDTVTYASASAISPAYSHALRKGRTYKVDLFNESPDSVIPDLSETIAFP